MKKLLVALLVTSVLSACGGMKTIPLNTQPAPSPQYPIHVMPPFFGFTPKVANFYTSMALDADKRYVAVIDWIGVHFFVVTDNNYPVFIKTITVPETQVQDIVSVGDKMVIVMGYTATLGVRVIDWSDRYNPTVGPLQSIGLPGQLYAVSKDDYKRIWISGTGADKVRVFDVNNFSTPVFEYNIGVPTGSTTVGQYTYVASYSEKKLYVFKNTRHHITFKRSVSANDAGRISRLENVGGHLMSTEYDGNKLAIFSLNNPNKPTVSKVYSFSGGIAEYTKPFGNTDHFYIATYNSIFKYSFSDNQLTHFMDLLQYKALMVNGTEDDIFVVGVRADNSKEFVTIPTF